MKTVKNAMTFVLLIGAGFCGAACSGKNQQQGGASGISGGADLGRVISAAQLKEAIDSGDENLVIIGVINPTAALVPLSPASKPIDGSYLVWRGDYSGGGTLEAISPEVTGIRKSKEDMEGLLSRAGITPNSIIVVYAADAMHDAARFAWQLRLLGLENVSYLDGGINAWIAAGYPTGKGVRLAEQPSKSEFKVSNYEPWKYDASITQVRDALRNPDEWVVIDTRSNDEYDGKRTGNSSGAFGTGRMKGAAHINWTDAVDSDTQLLKSKEELERIYGDLIRGKKVITYCQSGVRSAHTWLVLTELLGDKEAYNYDGSWIEWSFAASEASGNQYEDILELTEDWTDNKKPI